MIVVECYTDELQVDFDTLLTGFTPKMLKACINKSLERCTGHYQYGVEIPDDMAITLNHKGTVDYICKDCIRFRYYLINWHETNKILAADFKFGD